MSATVLLDQAVAFVRASFSRQEVKDVRRYAGEFSMAEMKNVSYTCPAILITVLGWKPAAAGSRMAGRHARNVRLAAFVVTKNAKSREDRMAEAMAIAENLSVVLRQWAPMVQTPYAGVFSALGLSVGGLDDDASCENLYNRAVDEQGQALWLVDWYQSTKGAIPINPTRPAVPYANLPDLKTVEVEDKVHVNQTPAEVVPPATDISVTEKIDFVNP